MGIPEYSLPEGEWYLFPDQPIIDRYKRRERPWRSYVVLPYANSVRRQRATEEHQA